MFSLQSLEKGGIREGKRIQDIKKRQVNWADFFQPSKEELEELSEIIGVQPKEIEELLLPKSRPILTNLDKYSVIVLQTMSAEKNSDITLPLLIFISKRTNDFITLHNHRVASISKIMSWDKKRLAKMFSKGTTFLLYTLIDEIIANYSESIEKIDSRIENLENSIYEPNVHSSRTMQDAFEVKKSLIYLYKALSANREVVSAIEKEYGIFLEKKDLSKFRILYSDITQLVELTITYRDILTTTIEVYLSVISNNLNITVKKLTGWGAIIIIPTVIASVYGMNFRYMPELSWKYGYVFALGLMLVSVIAAYCYFKKKEWI